MAIAVFIYSQDVMVSGRTLYKWLLREDGAVEALTAIFLALAALLSLIAALRVPEALRWSRTFFFLLAAFSMLMALEEFSWGQRVFKVESNEFFQQYSDQKEINFHNVMQQYLERNGYAVTKTKKLAAIVLFTYGVIFPILNMFTFRNFRLVIPPPALILGFFVGALLAWYDRPTGREEEIGELLFAMSFASLVPLWLLQQHYAADAPPIAS
ncbi:MAG: hypothetical protein H7X74_01855 [Methyloceanibacter sp.]|nr:hypothetical protein [Methyloceanibacter sp.]